MKKQFKQVEKEEFESFIKNYPNQLIHDCIGTSKPAVKAYCDFTTGKEWPDTMVAKIEMDYRGPDGEVVGGGSHRFWKYWILEEDKFKEALDKDRKDFDFGIYASGGVVGECVDKLHWFCLSYKGDSIETGLYTDASIYYGVADKYITKDIIDKSKPFAGVVDGAALVAASYLGHMTKADFEGK